MNKLSTLAVLLAAGFVAGPPGPTPSPFHESPGIATRVCESRSPPAPNHRLAGHLIDLCQDIGDNISKTVGKKISVKYVPVTSQNRIPLPQNGTVDLECGSTTNNADRQKDVAFGLTTFVTEVRMVVKAKS